METNEENKEMLTVQDAARESGLTEDAVRKAIAQGRLPHTVLYGRKLIDRKDWNEYRETARPGRPAKKEQSE